MRYTTKVATELTRGDRVVFDDGKVLEVIDRQGIVSTHSPGRIGYLLRGADDRVYRLSLPVDDRVEVA